MSGLRSTISVAQFPSMWRTGWDYCEIFVSALGYKLLLLSWRWGKAAESDGKQTAFGICHLRGQSSHGHWHARPNCNSCSDNVHSKMSHFNKQCGQDMGKESSQLYALTCGLVAKALTLLFLSFISNEGVQDPWGQLHRRTGQGPCTSSLWDLQHFPQFTKLGLLQGTSRKAAIMWLCSLLFLN